MLGERLSISGWWWLEHEIDFSIYWENLNWLIFFRGVETTNQIFNYPGIYIPIKIGECLAEKKRQKKTRCDLLVSCWSNCLFVPSHKSWSSAGRGRGRSSPIQVRQRGAPGGRGWGALILFFGDGCGPRRFGFNKFGAFGFYILIYSIWMYSIWM